MFVDKRSRTTPTPEESYVPSVNSKGDAPPHFTPPG